MPGIYWNKEVFPDAKYQCCTVHFCRNKKRMSGQIHTLLQITSISSMDDIQSFLKETIIKFMEDGLEAKLDDESRKQSYIKKILTTATAGAAAKRYISALKPQKYRCP